MLLIITEAKMYMFCWNGAITVVPSPVAFTAV